MINHLPERVTITIPLATLRAAIIALGSDARTWEVRATQCDDDDLRARLVGHANVSRNAESTLDSAMMKAVTESVQ